MELLVRSSTSLRKTMRKFNKIETDYKQYETPFGIFGKLFDVLFLEKHLIHFLLERNKILKEVSENAN